MDSEIIKFENVTFGYQDNQPVIFKNLDFSCPGGFVNLTGPNGVGKTTFLLLAGGRLLPQNGNIFIKNINTKDIESEEERNLLCSFVYQNMEFESDDEAETLLEYIFQNGNLTPEQKNQSFYNDICKVLELQGLMNKKLSALSKGEMQRVIIAFSLLYGSEITLMDEPVFALEEHQKEEILSFLKNYTKNFNKTIFISLHEIALSKKYFEKTILFLPKQEIIWGETKEILSKENLEKAFQIPYEMLKDREKLDRETLMALSKKA